MQERCDTAAKNVKQFKALLVGLAHTTKNVGTQNILHWTVGSAMLAFTMYSHLEFFLSLLLTLN